MVAAGVLFVLSAVRIYRLPAAERRGKKETTKRLRDLNWRPRALSPSYNAKWIMANRPIASMLLVSSLAGSLYQGINSLFPVYVRDVLHQDPTNSIYILAPSGIGYLIGAFGSPFFIRWFGERRSAVWSLALTAVGMVLLGAIDLVAQPLAVISPMRLLNLIPGVQLSDAVMAAGIAVLPASLGTTVASQSGQVYVNRNVPAQTQGSIFGLEQVQENALNLITVFLLGLVATVTGPQYVFLLAPIVVIGAVLGLVRYAYRHTTGEVPELSESIEFFTEDVPPQRIKNVRSKPKSKKKPSKPKSS